MEDLALPLLKANLGISKDNRDAYLQAILKSIISELTNEKGLTIDKSDNNRLMFVVDYAAWRYRSRGEGTMPRNIQYRLHNLILKEGGVEKSE